MRYLLDTNICIYSLKNRPPEVLARLQETPPEDVALSVITVLELRLGAAKSGNPEKAHRVLDDFLAPMLILPFAEEAAVVGANVKAHLQRLGTPIGDLDLLIAATALSNQMVLVTNNLREFERVPDLLTDNWVGP